MIPLKNQENAQNPTKEQKRKSYSKKSSSHNDLNTFIKSFFSLKVKQKIIY